MMKVGALSRHRARPNGAVLAHQADPSSAAKYAAARGALWALYLHVNGYIINALIIDDACGNGVGDQRAKM